MSLLWLKVSAVAAVPISVDGLSAELVFPTFLAPSAVVGVSDVVGGPAVAGVLCG